MSEIADFGTVVLVVSVGFSLALLASRLSDRFPVPAPALFLIAAAMASEIFPALGDRLSFRTVERIGVVALIVILFDGGMKVGARRFRRSAVPISVLGVVGTFATAGLVALAAHSLFGFGWTIAWILGAAIAPTDPAVMFSVLGRREVGGRSGTILEGESGANDPVGIALMVGMLDYATHHDASIGVVGVDFAIEMAVGLVVGVAGAWLLLQAMRRLPLGNEALYPLRTLAAAGVIYGVASVAHGSGFLAVFVAGLLVADERVPYKAEIERFHTSLASLAEIVAFVALGLTVEFSTLGRRDVWLDGLVLAVLLAFLLRPLVAGLLLLPVRLRQGERLFVMWGGLKGAVPILLGTLVVLAGIDQSQRLYGIVFVVVAFSVVVQGTSIPLVARRLGVPMRMVEAEPWSISIGLRAEPHGVQRFLVASGARADGSEIRDLPLGDRAWISLVIRGGAPRQARGSTELLEGDEVLVLAPPQDEKALRRLFQQPARRAEPVAG
jgi:cell volume regulation protein A